MEPRLRGAQRDTEDARRLGQRHPQEVVQDDNGSPGWIEPPEGIVDELSIDDVRRGVRIGDLWPVKRFQLDLDRSSLPATEGVDAGTDKEAVEPAVEGIQLAQSGQASPGPNERFLDRVAGKLSIAEDQSCGCVQPCGARADEHGEGVMIASPCTFHESSLVHGCLSSQRSRSGALGW